ncbi:c-type cytochrome [Marilutibacter alkalisoli]|uniref:Cytochrome c n=1 Tax=Marilutibacter alkalisoli TaxID=2591633 RepID=A0A514BWM8_9GAMM|nr:cytochrome c [Lysobacter alkalisoli]QDH71787.1 cytochrome c [Lysobacter alkalisoli]
MRPLTIAASLALATAIAFVPSRAEDDAGTSPTTEATAAASAPMGDAEKGRMLTYTCQGCHGITGYKNAYPSYKVPKIGGQSEEYLANALREYQKGTRKHPTMEAQAQSFSDQDIADIATFLSSIK